MTTPPRATAPGALPALAVTIAVAVVLVLAGPARAATGPDPARTPGQTDPSVTQSSLQESICAPGIVSSVHIPAKLRAQTFARYRIKESRQAKYLVDQLVPDALGGRVALKNLWPQPRVDAKVKDAAEAAAHDLVCAGLVDLAAAQQAMTADWSTAGQVVRQAAETRTASIATYLAAVEEARRQQELADYLASLPPPTRAPRVIPPRRPYTCPTPIDPSAECNPGAIGCTLIDGVLRSYNCWSAPAPGWMLLGEQR